MWLILLLLSIAAGITAGVLWEKTITKRDWYDKVRVGNPKLKRPAKGLGIFTIACAIGFLWITRPWWHWLWFNCFYMAPTVWIIIAVTTGLSIWLWKIERTRWFWTVFIVGFLMLLVVTPMLAKPLTMCKIYDEIKQATTIIEILPETSEIRYVPMEVAEAISKVQIGTSTRTVGDFDAVLDKEGHGIWSTPLVPTGGIRELTRQMEGIALLRSDGTIEFSDTFFKYGEGMAILDNVIWRLRERKYFVDYCETFCWFDGTTPIIVAPYLGYRYKFPVMVPYWGGTAVIYPDGTIKDYTPEEARNLPFLQGQRLLPERLALLFVESWAYQYGLPNKWWFHEDQIVVPKVAYSENQMPYLMPIGKEKRPTWMTATEPVGQAFGLSKIFFVDARQEKMEIYEAAKWDRTTQKYKIIKTLIGPDQAWGYGKGAPGIAEYKWIGVIVSAGESTKESEGTWRLLEPRPTFLEGRMFWMLTVASSECTVIQHTVLVDAGVAEAKENRFVFNTEAELRRYLETGVLKIAPEGITPLKGISPEAISQLEKMGQMYQEFQQKWEAEWAKLMELLK